jgi:hypothetical protein
MIDRLARPCRRWASLIVAATIVSGCSIIDSMTATPASTSAPSAGAGSAPAATLPPNGTRAARATPNPATPRPQPSAEIKVVGLSQAETAALLGPPASEAEQPPAKVWRYKVSECTIDVYFYLDVARNAFYALHYDAGNPSSSVGPAAGSTSPADLCLNRIYNARRQSR